MARVVEHDRFSGTSKLERSRNRDSDSRGPFSSDFLISLDIPGDRTTTSEGAVGDLRVGGRDGDFSRAMRRETELVLEDVIFAGVQHSFF